MRTARGLSGLVLAAFGVTLVTGALLYWLAVRRVDAATQPTDFGAIPAQVNFMAPALSLNGLDGAGHTLADQRGQVVLVNLWATWCPPCQAEMPLLQRYYERHRAEGFTVIAVEDGEPEADVRAFVGQHGLTFPVWLDPQHQATDHAFNAMNLPTSFVIDRSGQVRLEWVGAINEANLERFVTPLIAER
jgi:cytochrome c biogenesis protein CcmG, thiol:disulfide interchange protein DsbE